MPVAGQAMTKEEQLEDLRRRFQLLEGERKANFETAKLNIQQNKEIIKQMKEENKELQEQIANMRRGNGLASPEKMVELTVLKQRLTDVTMRMSVAQNDRKGDNTQLELDQLRNEKAQLMHTMNEYRRPDRSTGETLDTNMTNVQQLQKRVDGLTGENLAKEKFLQELRTSLKDLERNCQLHTDEASPQMRQIRVLENRLDKVMIKFNEAQSIRKTYEAIEKRLRQERVGFDNQLATIERTLKAKERDYEELLLLSHNAYHAKEMALAELHRFEQGVMEERNQRDREVREKKILVQQRVDMNQRLENRERMLRKQAEATKQMEVQSRDLPTFAPATQDLGATEEKQRLTEYEEAFDRIKEATGIDDVNEVLQKFLMQEDNYNQLVSLTKENTSKIEQLTEERRKIRQQVEELKFGSGGQGSRRAAIDQKEQELATATELSERNRSRFERARKVFIEVKAGVGHLAEMLEPIKIDVDTQIMEVTDDNVEEVLQHSELKLSKLLGIVHRLEDPTNRDRGTGIDDDTYEEKLLSKSQSDIRIRINEGDGDDGDDGDDFDDEDEDVCNRKHVKYNSEQIMERQQARERKKNKKKKVAA